MNNIRIDAPEKKETLIEKEVEIIQEPWFFLSKEWLVGHLTLTECSGCFGDFGTFIPLTVGLAKDGRIDFAFVLLAAGIQHLTTVFWCHAPIAVQPFHAMAAQMLLNEDISYDDLATAGLIMGATMFLMAATNLITFINDVIPLSIIRGIQLGLGVGLIEKALKAIWALPFDHLDSPTLAIASVALCFITERFWKKFPVSMFLFVSGVIIAFASHAVSVTFGIDFSNMVRTPTSNWHVTIGQLFLPQLPMTTLNAVVATGKLMQDLFPERPSPGVRPIAASIGVNNLVLPMLGGFPSCHGAGGLAGQYLFGARANTSMLVLSILQITLALCFGNSLVNVLKYFPTSILEVLLFMTGLELATHVKDVREKKDWVVVLVTAGGSLYKNSGIGFLLGFSIVLFNWACDYFSPPENDVDLDRP